MLRSSATARNKKYILEFLSPYLETLLKESQFSHEKLKILEIASGYGEHIHFLAQHFPTINFYPTEIDLECLRSIQSYADEYELRNVHKPIKIDICDPVQNWDSKVFCPASFNIVICINMIHITPIRCTECLFSASNWLLKRGGIMYTYGPYSVNGKIFPESNVLFNDSLKQSNPLWGLKDITDLERIAENNYLKLEMIYDMPSNNKSLIWRKM